MKSRFSVAFLLLLLLASAQPLLAKTNPETLALKAVSENSAEAEPAIAELRALGRRIEHTLFKLTPARLTNKLQIRSSPKHRNGNG